MKKYIKNICILFLLMIFIIIIPKDNVLAAEDFDFKFEIDFDSSGNANGIDISSPIKVGDNDALSDSVAKGAVWNLLLQKYKILITGFLGAATLTLLGLGMYAMTNLSTSAGNPQKRKEAIIGIALCFLSAALLGSGTVIFGYAYNVFR